jgi:hypothetical protein
MHEANCQWNAPCEIPDDRLGESTSPLMANEAENGAELSRGYCHRLHTLHTLPTLPTLATMATLIYKPAIAHAVALPTNCCTLCTWVEGASLSPSRPSASRREPNKPNVTT